ncbi:MAG: glycerol-3-phosphate acyltransferase, partial [Sphingomonadaceae bacterium]
DLFALAWGLVALVTRISSAGGMSAGFAAALALLLAGQREAALLVALLALWVLFTHRANIARLRAGTEPRIGAR